MGQAFWISGLLIAVAIAVGAGLKSGAQDVAEPVSFLEEEAPAYGDAQRLGDGSTGSALATAAFGLSALQPETFNSEIVLDIIEASPLAYAEKDRLTAKLIDATAGRAELPQVLEYIRVSLAIE